MPGTAAPPRSSSPHPMVDRAFRRALADLRLLVDSGPGPGERFIAAGVPWYNALFGRDAIITALQLLTHPPPGRARDPARCSPGSRRRASTTGATREPGKILHELRTGEMAAAGEIPHTPYYGSVDSTPAVADAARRIRALDRRPRARRPPLADRARLPATGSTRPATSTATASWSTQRRSSRGLLNQGWKDSGEAIRWRGRHASPRARSRWSRCRRTCTRARLEMARLARLRGDAAAGAMRQERSRRASSAARFEAALLAARTPAPTRMALDGAQAAPSTRSRPTPGHVLWCGIASPERARRVAESLLGPDLFSGWGIRTLSSRDGRLQPDRLPHRQRLAARQRASRRRACWRYGLREEAARVAGAMLEATQYFRDARLPELFCGFDRGELARTRCPTRWPARRRRGRPARCSSCSARCSGFEPDAAGHELRLVSPTLPEWLPEVRLENLRVGDAVVDLLVRRQRRLDGRGGAAPDRATCSVSCVPGV